ncbi:MAG: DUF3052 family protein [Dehalococcoidia bacterium]
MPKKLGVKEGSRVAMLGGPSAVAAEVAAAGGVAAPVAEGGIDVIVWFVTERVELEAGFLEFGRALQPAGGLWVAWPKRASKLPTDITEDVIREVCLPSGLVDNKVCAIDATWSGLRLVWRKELRP